MEKTGERYAAARRHLGKPDALVTDDLGMSDEAISRRTGDLQVHGRPARARRRGPGEGFWKEQLSALNDLLAR